MNRPPLRRRAPAPRSGFPQLAAGGPRRRALFSVVALVAALSSGVLAACGSGDDAKITVAAAASLRSALGDPDEGGAGTGGEGEVRFTFGGSDLLASQIRQGANVDVIAAASTIQPDQLRRAGLVEAPVEFAGNRLVIAVPTDSALDSINDIAEPGTSLVIGDGSVPIGIYARQMISRLPESTGRAIMDNVRSQEQDATSITAKLTQQAADAGIVYATDVLNAPDQLREIDVPRRLQPRIAYSAAVVASTDRPEAARAFVTDLGSGDRAAALNAAGLLSAP